MTGYGATGQMQVTKKCGHKRTIYTSDAHPEYVEAAKRMDCAVCAQWRCPSCGSLETAKLSPAASKRLDKRTHNCLTCGYYWTKGER